MKLILPLAVIFITMSSFTSASTTKKKSNYSSILADEIAAESPFLYIDLDCFTVARDIVISYDGVINLSNVGTVNRSTVKNEFFFYKF